MPGKPENIYDNTELTIILKNVNNYKNLSPEAREIFKETNIKYKPSGAERPYDMDHIYYMIRVLTDVSLDSVRKSLILRTGVVLSNKSIQRYKRVVIEVSKALLCTHRNGIALHIKKEEGKHYLTDQQSSRLNTLRKKGVPIEDMINYLQKLL
ncbi:hypothetical protein [Klebsiella phage phiKp_21]|nr:hypothetical protein [Klebsiella phage phiKp_21]